MWHLRPWPWPTGTSPTPLTHPHECLFALRLVLQSDKRPSPSDTFSGFKNRQFRQHFSTGRYCSVGEGASVADGEGEVHNDHLPRWDWIYCPHTLPRNLGTPRKTWQEMWIVHGYNTNAASVALVETLTEHFFNWQRLQVAEELLGERSYRKGERELGVRGVGQLGPRALRSQRLLRIWNSAD